MNIIDNNQKHLVFNALNMPSNTTTPAMFILKQPQDQVIKHEQQIKQEPTILTDLATSPDSDLTELSWLTNSMNVFNNTNINTVVQQNTKSTPPSLLAANQLQFETCLRQEKENFHSLDDLDSSFSSTISSLSFSSISSTTSSISTPVTQTTTTIAASHLTKQIPQFLKYENKATSAAIVSDTQLQSNVITTSTNTPDSKISFTFTKPPLTLSCLIFMSIQESKHKCLPVRDIYDWIETNFPYYKTITNGWKSSIRHNLSFSKCFKKMDRVESCKYLNGRLNGKISTQRSINACGTCWKVNTECKTFLIYTLKKSSFWLKYSKLYPSLARLIQNTVYDDLNVVSNHHHYHLHKQAKQPQTIVKQEEQIPINDTTNSCVDMDYCDDDDMDVGDMCSLSTTNSVSSFTSNKSGEDNDDDVTKAAEILMSNRCHRPVVIDNTITQQFHHKKFSYLTLTNSTNNNNKETNGLNSDLEIEVASTLIRLKSLIETRN